MKWLAIGLSILMLAMIGGCSVRKPTARPMVSVSYDQADRIKVTEKLVSILEANKIGVASKDIRGGIIVTDSFDVLPEYCDCGRNFIGSEYPGIRHGVMKIAVTGAKDITITFDFKTHLEINGNHMKLTCTSFGILEKKLLDQLDKETGLTQSRAYDQNSGR